MTMKSVFISAGHSHTDPGALESGVREAVTGSKFGGLHA